MKLLKKKKDWSLMQKLWDVIIIRYYWCSIQTREVWRPHNIDEYGVSSNFCILWLYHILLHLRFSSNLPSGVPVRTCNFDQFQEDQSSQSFGSTAKLIQWAGWKRGTMKTDSIKNIKEQIVTRGRIIVVKQKWALMTTYKTRIVPQKAP